MKKKLLLLNVLILVALTTFAQNGVTSYTLPTGWNQYRNCLKIDASGNKWVGFDRIGLGKFDGSTWTMFDTLNSTIPSNKINDVAFDASNNMWVATIKGLAKYNGSVWTKYNVSNSGLPDDSVSCLFIKNSDIWIGTRNGLAKLNGSTWTIYNTSNSALTTNRIQCVNIESNNDVWVGTRIGLFKKSGSSWTNYGSINPYLLSNYNVLSICIDSNNDKWIGSSNMIFKLVGNNFTPVSSLFSNYNITFSNTYSLIKGPHGGVAFLGVYGLTEIVGYQLYSYSGIGGNYCAFDSSTGLIWYINKISGSFLYSFNSQNYIGNSILSPFVGTNTLDINEVRAGLMNRGSIFWDGVANAGYEVPKNSGRHAAFASSLWIGGIDNGGTLHQAAMTYGQSGDGYQPGPLDTLSGIVDSITSASYDKIWKIDRLNIEEFKTNFANGSVQNGTYTVSNDILAWPAVGIGNYTRNMAPFVDVNGDGLYKPLTDGDYPKISGDQMCYWIFNDNLQSINSDSLPFKVEVHASAYAFTCPQITDSLQALNYTTFYNYEINNRSTTNYSNTYLGNWNDMDLGFYMDDYVGCNPSNNYGYAYNGTYMDGSGQFGAYGAKPPMISTVVLNGPLAEPNDSIDNNNNGVIDEAGEKILMTSFIYFNNNSDPVNGNPGSSSFTTAANDYYNYSRGIWKNGTPMTYGGNGIGGSIPTRFMYDAAPGSTGWNEINAGNVPDDRRFVMGCGPFNLNAGQHVNYSYALVWTRDLVSAYTIGNLYNKNLADVKKVQQWYAAGNYPSCYDLQAGVNSIQKNNSSFTLYPNPANTQITIAYKAETKNARIELFNATGQKINSFVYFNQQQTIDISGFAYGLYLIKITDGKNNSVQRFVKN